MKLLITGLLFSLAFALSTEAQVLFFDDFQTPNDTVGAVPVDWNSTANDTTLPGIGTTFVSNTGSPFSGGAGNQYVDIYDEVSSTILARGSMSSSLDNAATLFAFDFYEPARVGTTFDEGFSVGYSTGGDINNSTGWTISLDNGVIGNLTGGTTAYSMGTAYRFYVAVNDTASSIFYTPVGLPTVSIAPGTINVYFGSELGGTVTYAGSRTITSGTLSRLGFRTFTTGGQNVYIDDVSVSVIPEPGSMAMLSLGVGSLLAFRRRPASPSR